jgi:hypothetical protein
MIRINKNIIISDIDVYVINKYLYNKSLNRGRKIRSNTYLFDNNEEFCLLPYSFKNKIKIGSSRCTRLIRFNHKLNKELIFYSYVKFFYGYYTRVLSSILRIYNFLSETKISKKIKAIFTLYKPKVTSSIAFIKERRKKYFKFFTKIKKKIAHSYNLFRVPLKKLFRKRFKKLLKKRFKRRRLKKFKRKLKKRRKVLLYKRPIKVLLSKEQLKAHLIARFRIKRNRLPLSKYKLKVKKYDSRKKKRKRLYKTYIWR